MSEEHFIKNVTFSEPVVLADMVDYQEGRVVSRTFAQNKVMSLTLFAFAEGEGLSSHTAAGDAFVQVLDGEASIEIGDKQVTVKSGEVVVMPANLPHSLQAVKRFKMLLTVVKASG
jgi:quercetin dioxygenase-like cupin family protein